MFRFLHISDPHIRDAGRNETVLKQIVEDLNRGLGLDSLDAVVIAGDSADKAAVEQFECAAEFVQGLAAEFKVSANRILVVPGNHDIDWQVSKESYQALRREKFGETTPVAHWQESESSPYVEVVTDAELYKDRLAAYAKYHRRLTGSDYPRDYGDQWSMVASEDRSVLLLGLNSAWALDHHHPDQAKINSRALNRALEAVRHDFADSAKIAIWHHPVGGPDAPLVETAFLERLVVNGFGVVLHGHLHQPVQGIFPYESEGRQLPIIGAGTVDGEPQPGHSWQYNVITVDGTHAAIESRMKTERDGAWGPGPTFRVQPGLAPQQRLEIDLTPFVTHSVLAEVSEPSTDPHRMAPLEKLRDLTRHLGGEGFDPAGYRIAVEALIFDANGRLLLQVRGPECRDEVGKLEGVGGQLDQEDLISCLQAHIDGEIGAGARVEVEELLEARPVQFLERDQAEDWIVVSYLCRLLEGEPIIVDEGKTAALRWLDIAELHNLPDEQLSRSTSRARDLYWLRYRSRPYFAASEDS